MKLSRGLGLVMAALLTLGVAGCGSDSPTGATASTPNETGGLTKVTLAALAVGQLGTLVLAKDQGIFEKHGFDLEFSFIEPAALIPTLLSGDADYTWLNAPGLLIARTNNVPIKAVATVSVAGDDPETFPTQLLVPKGSSIKTAQDLVGKTVATASLFQLPDLALMAWMMDAGLKPTDVNFVEIPFANMAEALAGGRVDAVLSSEPFVSISKATDGVERVVSGSEGLLPTSPVSIIIASESYIAENADQVTSFQAALVEATEYAKAHEDDVRATIPTFTELKPELAKTIMLAPIDATTDPAAWDAWADLLLEVGAVKTKPVAADAFIAS